MAPASQGGSLPPTPRAGRVEIEGRICPNRISPSSCNKYPSLFLMAKDKRLPPFFLSMGNLKPCFVSSPFVCLSQLSLGLGLWAQSIYSKYPAFSTQHQVLALALVWHLGELRQSLRKVTDNCTLTLASAIRVLKRAGYPSSTLQGLSPSNPGVPGCHCICQNYPMMMIALQLRSPFRLWEGMRPVGRDQALKI